MADQMQQHVEDNNRVDEMYDHHHHNHDGEERTVKVDHQDGAPAAAVEATDRGLFDFWKKKNTQEEDQVISHEFDQKVQVSDDDHHPEHKEEEEKKHEGGLLQKHHRSHSSSSSSSSSEEEVEVEEGGEKKKIRKKKEKKGKKSGEDTNIPVEKCDDAAAGEEKKGFLDKIKEKLPGGNKETTDHHEDQVASAPAPAPAPAPEHHGHDGADQAAAGKEEKKGFLEKIKEKLPGYHPKNNGEDEK